MRPDRSNARRTLGETTYHLKWFARRLLSNPAWVEWKAASTLASLEIPTVDPVGWGFHALGTFIVLRGSPGLSADRWRDFAPDGRTRTRLAVEFGRLVARLHSAGLCHRDLNVYHALVHEGHVRIIDVGRVARFSRRRWIVKDLASLHASSVREGLPASTARAFLRTYLDRFDRPIARRRLLSAVLRKSERIRRHVAKHAPRA